MITIDEARTIKYEIANEKLTTVSCLTFNAIAELAISQHEEIKMLRAELAICKDRIKLYDYTLPSLGDGITRAKDESYERAAQVCENVSAYDDYDPSETFAEAIRALKSGEPK